MLTFFKTPRILIPHVYAPIVASFDHGRGDRGTSTRFVVTVEIDAATEADLPEYIRAKVVEAQWYGVPTGTRCIHVSSGEVRPAIFGVTVEDFTRSRTFNVDPDQMLRDQPATICVTMGRKKGRDTGTWPILRAVHVEGVNLPLPGLQGFHAYVESRAAHWEFRE